jgi:hypothetical protein
MEDGVYKSHLSLSLYLLTTVDDKPLCVSSPLLLVITAASPALGSIWGSDPQQTPWTQEQLEKSQNYFHGVKDDSFNTWNESRLRQFLIG